MHQQAPVLAACIFSHLGELSSVAIRAIEVITIAYRVMVGMCYFGGWGGVEASYD